MSEPKKLKLMFDTNIYDRLDSDTDVNEVLQRLVRENKIELVTTHIQEDELALAPKPVAVLGNTIPTEGFVLGVSKLGRATLGGGSESQKIPTAGAVWGVSKWGDATWGNGMGNGLSVDDIKTEQGNHAKDALIATTASQHVDYLITEDKRLLKKIKKTHAKCEVLDFEGLKSLLSGI